MDEYKVKQLLRMLVHETGEAEHYGARLSHHEAGTKVLTIDAGGLRALLSYYSQNDDRAETSISPINTERRDDFLVTAGIRAGHMEAQNIIELPGDVEGEHRAAIEIAKAADLYMEKEEDDDEPWDCFIEEFLESHYPAVGTREAGTYGLPKNIVKLCETVFDLAFTAGEKMEDGTLPRPEDSRSIFASIMDLAVKFEQNYDDSEDYLEAISDYAEKELPLSMRKLTN